MPVTLRWTYWYKTVGAPSLCVMVVRVQSIFGGYIKERSKLKNARHFSKESRYPYCISCSSHLNPQFLVEEQWAFMRHHKNSFAFCNVIRPCSCLIFNAVRRWLNSKTFGCCPSANGSENLQVTNLQVTNGPSKVIVRFSTKPLVDRLRRTIVVKQVGVHQTVDETVD